MRHCCQADTSSRPRHGTLSEKGFQKTKEVATRAKIWVCRTKINEPIFKVLFQELRHGDAVCVSLIECLQVPCAWRGTGSLWRRMGT